MYLYDLNKGFEHISSLLVNPLEEKSKYDNIKVLSFDKETCIIRYDRKKLSKEQYATLGLLRSLIVKNGKIMSYSPPKSVDYEEFKKEYDINKVRVEEIVEGTMLHMYWDKEKSEWIYGTKSSIYGKHSFYDNGEVINKMTFSEMFLECLKSAKVDMNKMSKEYSYCFVMQHPKNRIVKHIRNPELYLISMYSIVDNNIKELFEGITIFKETDIKYPRVCEVSSYDELERFVNGQICKDINMSYECPGVMIKSEGVRSKLRNSKYEYVKRLKGNQPKLMYQYLYLKKEQKIKEYLYYFPEVKEKFDKYDERVREFIQKLYQYYVNCFIFKEKDLTEYPYEFRNHLYVLHSHYLNHKLYNNAKNMGYEHVKRYINGLEPAQLMFSLNFHLREKKEKKDLVDMEL